MNKEDFWKHFLHNSQYWPRGFTVKRLQKVKMLCVDAVWSDIVRHGGDILTPQQMKINNPENYDHCMSNMGALIRESMYKNGILND